MVYRALPNKTYLSLGLRSHLISIKKIGPGRLAYVQLYASRLDPDG